MNVKIIVDSTADLRPEVAARVGIVPLSVHFGDREYVSGVNITPQQFYEMLVESDELPTTSQPTPYDFESVYQKVIAAGAGYSLLIEIFQLPFFDRVSDIDDLLLNSLGFLMGYGIYLLVRTLKRIHVRRRGRK